MRMFFVNVIICTHKHIYIVPLYMTLYTEDCDSTIQRAPSVHPASTLIGMLPISHSTRRCSCCIAYVHRHQPRLCPACSCCHAVCMHLWLVKATVHATRAMVASEIASIHTACHHASILIKKVYIHIFFSSAVVYLYIKEVLYELHQPDGMACGHVRTQS